MELGEEWTSALFCAYLIVFANFRCKNVHNQVKLSLTVIDVAFVVIEVRCFTLDVT